MTHPVVFCTLVGGARGSMAVWRRVTLLKSIPGVRVVGREERIALTVNAAILVGGSRGSRGRGGNGRDRRGGGRGNVVRCGFESGVIRRLCALERGPQLDGLSVGVALYSEAVYA